MFRHTPGPSHGIPGSPFNDALNRELQPVPCVPRRDFLKLAGIGFAGAAAGHAPHIMAGAFTPGDVKADHLVPADKKLDAAWVASLFERGSKEIYRGDGLEKIGMPCGGIGSGQLYLCGDGTLGEWQIFNRAKSHWVGNTRATYNHQGIAKPVDQGFAVAVRAGDADPVVRTLSRDGFRDVSFQGEYPIATVGYEDKAIPVRVSMEAFSPFIPLNAADSALPATLFHITVTNTSRQAVRASILGWLENAVASRVAQSLPGEKLTEFASDRGRQFVLHGAKPLATEATSAKRPPDVFEDFESTDYGNWTVVGDAFGKGPAKGTISAFGQQEVTGFQGKGLVNSFVAGDRLKGKLISREFTIDRPFINLLVGGGEYAGETCVNLDVGGKVARTAVGQTSEQLQWQTWHVQELVGQKARIEIVDDATGGWGHILVDQIEFADAPPPSVAGQFEKAADFGTMTLACADPAESDGPRANLPPGLPADALVDGSTTRPVGEKLVGLIRSEELELAAGEQKTVTFVVAWHFPNAEHGHFYTNRFVDAQAVASYVLDEHDRLTGDTRLWRDTYYDSSLPYWLLDRLLSTVSTLSTGTCQWWANGRFYAYEGVTCCAGTCTHVWNYAHTHARLFPELARSIREMQDFSPRAEGGGFHPESGLVGFRSNDAYAADGQCGTILKAYREHLMSADNTFLHRFWPRIKKALEYSIAQDGNADGLIENTQHNTYDINYEGPNTFVGSLYLAALRAGEQMAREVDDAIFAKRCRAIFESGTRRTQERLWDGEYFIQDVDLKVHPQHQYGKGCLSDHLFGQGWAHQLALGYIYPSERIHSALAAVWKYNWAPNTTPYNQAHKPYRWYVSPGQAGLFTCTWPKSDYLPRGTVYKNEVWTGIEYQVAGHMIAEGMLTEGLAICRAVHDRYSASLRNPYNEVECGDHYARAMASWGVFLALAGFEYHGPQGHLGFAPRITPHAFKAAFTTAEGWGTFEQTRDGDTQTERITCRWGTLRLRSLAFTLPAAPDSLTATITVPAGDVVATVDVDSDRVRLLLDKPVAIRPGETLTVRVGSGQ